jgi:hypothetical protein
MNSIYITEGLMRLRHEEHVAGELLDILSAETQWNNMSLLNYLVSVGEAVQHTAVYINIYIYLYIYIQTLCHNPGVSANGGK